MRLCNILGSCRDNASEGEADVKPGKIVAGTVAHVSDSVVILDISTAKGSVKGYLTFPHLSDNLGRNKFCVQIVPLWISFVRFILLCLYLLDCISRNFDIS